MATGQVAINPVNDAPAAQDDSYSVAEDGTLAVTGTGVLGNDADVDGNPLTVASPRPETSPAHGHLTLNADGSFTYVPFANFHGEDSFTYRVTDGTAASEIATVRIAVTPVNDAPVARNDATKTAEDTAISGSVLGNDSDVEGSTLTAILEGGPAHGSVVLNPDGTFTYTPNANFHGTDTFTYRASDGHASTRTPATVTITVTPGQRRPGGWGRRGDHGRGHGRHRHRPGQRHGRGRRRPDATLVTGPAHGTLTLNTDGSFTYMPGGQLQRVGQLHVPGQRRDGGERGHRDGHDHRPAVNDAPVAATTPPRWPRTGRSRSRSWANDRRGQPGRA